MKYILNFFAGILLTGCHTISIEKASDQSTSNNSSKLLFDGKTFKGWEEDISNTTSFEDLPNEAKEYIKFIEDFIKVPITFISVGPERNQNIIR